MVEYGSRDGNTQYSQGVVTPYRPEISAIQLFSRLCKGFVGGL